MIPYNYIYIHVLCLWDVFIHIYIYMHACMYYVCMNAWMHACIYIYIYKIYAMYIYIIVNKFGGP